MENPNKFGKQEIKPGKEEVPFKGESQKEGKELAIAQSMQKSSSSNALTAPDELTSSIFDTKDIQEKNKLIAAAFIKVNHLLDEIERFPSNFKDCYDDVKFLGRITNNASLAKWAMPLVPQQYEGIADSRKESVLKMDTAVNIMCYIIYAGLLIKWIRAEKATQDEKIEIMNLGMALHTSYSFFRILSLAKFHRISEEVRSEINADSMALNKAIGKQEPEADYIALTNLILLIKENMAEIRESLNDHQQNIMQLISPIATLSELPTVTFPEMEKEIEKQVGVLKTAQDIIAINKAIKITGLWMLLSSFDLA
ncbi:hypothetical protein HYX58_01600 [Candidatus Dependentiae bacterium]|nr:hypothetical protein [Candidatus Dependentiae bacterium]